MTNVTTIANMTDAEAAAWALAIIGWMARHPTGPESLTWRSFASSVAVVCDSLQWYETAETLRYCLEPFSSWWNLIYLAEDDIRQAVRLERATYNTFERRLAA